MTCAEFLAGFSDYYDCDPSTEGRAAFEEHMRTCRSCARYREVVERGAELFRSLPPSSVRDDFRDRLRHSIYQYDEERRREGNSFGASRTMTLVAAAAAFAAVVGGSLVLRPERPPVDLSPIVVRGPVSEEPAGLRPAPVTPSLPSPEVRRVVAEPVSKSRVQIPVSVAVPLARTDLVPRLRSADLWDGANVLLYEHSSLYQRSRAPGLVRTGLR